MSSSLHRQQENVCGQCSKPQHVPERSLTSSVAGLVHDAIPHHNVHPQNEPEKIEWVSFDHPDLSDSQWREYLRVRYGCEPPVIIVVGLARGFQIWALMQHGDCEELVSDRSGPVKSVTFLPALVVSFSEQLQIFDTLNFSSRLIIKNCQRHPDPSSGVPFSLKSSWLTYADSKVSASHKSCGGVIASEVMSTYTTQVFSAAKNLSSTLSALSESVATGLAGKTSGTKTAMQGVLSVVDLTTYRETQVSNCVYSKNGIVAHFVSQLMERIGFVDFGPSPSLIGTSGESSTVFNIFSLHPHPLSSNLSAVHHIYTLFRGNTPAKVLGMCFSPDARWFCVSTNHGTTHAYSITPYGGPINFRSHGSSKIVNRDSRYHKSSGLNNLQLNILNTSMSNIHIQGSKGCPPRDIHPAQDPSHSSLCRMISNRRLPPYPSPTVISHASVKLHQAYLGAFTSWTPDLQGSISVAHNPSAQFAQHKLTAQFASPRGYSALNQGVNNCGSPFPSLYIINGWGQLMEHCINVNTPLSKPSHETPVTFTSTPVAQWLLHRTKSSVDVRCPLSDEHLLVTASDLVHRYANNVHCNANRPISANESNNQWISQVEMITYSGPHRRLWMGPQFTFKTFAEPSQPTALVSPNEKHDRGRSEPMNISSVRSSRMSGRSVPVVLEASSASFDKTPNVTMEVCGSWSDNDYISCDEQEGRVRKCIAEAMNDKGPLSSINDDDNCTMEDARSSLSGSSESSRDLHIV